MFRKEIFTIVLLLFLLPLNTEASKLEKDNARTNLDQFSSFAYAVDPTYEIEDEDIEIVKKNPNTKFAIGIGLNSTFNVTEEARSFLKKNPNTLFAYSLAQNENYKINSSDRSFLKSNPSTLFAFGLSRNPSYSSGQMSNTKSNDLDSSRFLFTKNFKSWLSSKNIVIPAPALSAYNLITNIIMFPFDFLHTNFLLFDFLEMPLSAWSGWTFIHAIIVLSFFSSLFIPRQRKQ